MADSVFLASLVDDSRECLETAPTLIDLVQQLNLTSVLRSTDYDRFETLTYDLLPMTQALLCRELAGLS